MSVARSDAATATTGGDDDDGDNNEAMLAEDAGAGSCRVRLRRFESELGCRRRGLIFGVCGEVKSRRAVGWLLLLIQLYCRSSFGVTMVVAALGVDVFGPKPSVGACDSCECHSDQMVGARAGRPALSTVIRGLLPAPAVEPPPPPLPPTRSGALFSLLPDGGVFSPPS